MPLYEYLCAECSTHFERYVRAFGEDVTCPACCSNLVEKQLSSFALATAAAPGPAPAAPRGACCGGGCGCAR
jgi:putative FmdB family regulatory protein